MNNNTESLKKSAKAMIKVCPQKAYDTLKEIANDLHLLWIHIHIGYLYNEIAQLPFNEMFVLRASYGLMANHFDIPSCAEKLKITTIQVQEAFNNAQRLLLEKKDCFYFPNINFLEEVESISNLEKLSKQAHDVLECAGKRYIREVEDMPLGELASLPGLYPQDYLSIIQALKEYKKNK